MSNDATRAATRAAAAAEAAALAGGTVPPPPDGGDATDSLTPGGNAADAPAGGGVADPPAGGGVDGVLHRLELSLDAISTRLAAVEAGREAARDPPPRVPPVLGALPPPPAPAAAAAAAAGDFGLPAAGLADVIATSVAKALKQQSKDKDHDTAVKDDLFTDEKACRVATLDRPLEFFLLPGCARTEFSSPFRLETWRYSTDWPANRREQRVGAAAEAGHLSILGAWSSKMHNDI